MSCESRGGTDEAGNVGYFWIRPEELEEMRAEGASSTGKELVNDQ